MSEMGLIVLNIICLMFTAWSVGIGTVAAIGIKRDWKHRKRVHVSDRILGHAFVCVLCAMGLWLFIWVFIGANFH